MTRKGTRNLKLTLHGLKPGVYELGSLIYLGISRIYPRRLFDDNRNRPHSGRFRYTYYTYIYIYIQWALVYPTMFVPHKKCRINQVLNKSGQIVHRVVVVIHSRVLDK